MRTELPVCTRCCFCMPLRYGLIGWGYLKLITYSLLLLTMSYDMYRTIRGCLTIHISLVNGHTIFLAVFIIVLMSNISFTIVLLIGGHKKNAHLLRVNYIFTLGMWILTMVGVVALICFMFTTLALLSVYVAVEVVVTDGIALVIFVVLDGYFVLLLRSELHKLTNNCEFRFENHASEAQCTLTV